ncbi:hypothetical protein [Spiribacter onubensis]|uniref:Uncharacterized protein n=1 Tax=Spiribacter onubensis TaxID=3122420 RepID=A0ABV3S807_9GAMM
MKIDPNTQTWEAVREWAIDQREGAVERLIGGAYPDKDERIRGRIQALDELLDLPNKPGE